MQKQLQLQSELSFMSKSIWAQPQFAGTDHFKMIVESATQGIWLFDTQARTIYANPSLLVSIDHTAKELHGSTLFDFCLADDIPFAEEKVNQSLKGESEKFDCRFLTSKDKLLWMMASTSPLRNEEGTIIGVIGLFSDITDNITEKQNAQRERDTLNTQLNELISIAPIGIAFINNDLQYMKINKMLSAINGLPASEHLNKTPAEILPQPLGTSVTKMLQEVLKTKEAITFEYEGPSSDSEREHRWWTSTYYPIELNNGEYAVGALVQDITEQKLSERRKDDFISMASHELKTPVTTIKAFTQILQRVPNIEEEKSKDYLQKISSEVNRLTKLINDFLDISKIRTGRLRIIHEQFSFDELVEECVVAYKALFRDFEIKVEGSVEKDVMADRSRIAQVIRNLLDNAIKYSTGNKKIIIKLTSTAKEVKFEVRDYGIGIAKENQVRIFESFYRAFESEKVDYPGLGIGLYIAAEVIKAHAGKIGVKSKKGRGSLFYFTIPVGKK